MPSLPRSILRNAVKICDEVTKDWQPTIYFRRWVSSDGQGTKVYVPPEPGTGRPMKVLVEWKQQKVEVMGVHSTSRATVTFLDIKDLLEATANRGVGTNDVIVLTDGVKYPILSIGGFVDAGTGVPVATEAYLG